MEAITVRAVRAGDLEQLMQLDRITFGEHAYPPSVVRQYTEVFPELTLLALDSAGMPRAFCFAALAAGADTGWVLALGVDPSIRRAGFGRTLIEAELRRLRALGAARVRLSCAPDAEGPIAFYQSLGFTVIERIENFLGPGRHRLIFEREL